MSRRTRIAVMIALAVVTALIVAVVVLSSQPTGPDVDPNHPMPRF